MSKTTMNRMRSIEKTIYSLYSEGGGTTELTLTDDQELELEEIKRPVRAQL